LYASLPGAFGRVTALGTGPLLLGTAALLLIGLLKTPLRCAGHPRGRLGGVRAAAGGSDIRRRADLRCAVPTAGSLCITAAAILLRFTNGLPRMPMAATAPRRRSGARYGASGGALALRREGAGFVIEAARTEGFDRPWSPQRARRAAAPASPDAATDVPPASRSPPRDATPRSKDLQPDD
jgi:competence protein ComEC